MTAAEGALIIVWISVTAYALLGGADFGAGLWDLLAGGGSRGQARRRLIERAIGPVWEANHVWLIFVLVILWTAFPRAVPPLMTTLYRPLMLVALGVILRGTGFALRSTLTGRLRPLLSTSFAASSLVTPWFLGAFAGAVASGRVPGDPSTSWLHPVSLAGGTLAVACCAYLGAVYLCGEAHRGHHAELAADFRLRALLAGGVCAAATLVGAAVLRLDAPQLFHGFTHRAWPVSALSASAAIVSIGLLIARRYRAARVASAVGVAAVLWAWGVAQWPYMIPPGLTVAGAAAAPPTLDALIVTGAAGSALLVPALACLFVLKGRGTLREPDTVSAPSPP